MTTDEQEPVTQSVLRLTEDSHKRLKARSAMQGVTMRDAIQRAVDLYLGESDSGPEIPKRLRPYLKMIEALFLSGDNAAINSVLPMIEYAYRSHTRSGEASRKRR